MKKNGKKEKAPACPHAETRAESDGTYVWCKACGYICLYAHEGQLSKKNAKLCSLPSYAARRPEKKIDCKTLAAISSLMRGCMRCDRLAHHFYLSGCARCSGVDSHLKLRYLAERWRGMKPKKKMARCASCPNSAECFFKAKSRRG